MDRINGFEDILDECYSQFGNIYRINQEALVQAGYEKVKGVQKCNASTDLNQVGSPKPIDTTIFSRFRIEFSVWAVTALYACYVYSTYLQSYNPLIDLVRMINILRSVSDDGTNRRN